MRIMSMHKTTQEAEAGAPPSPELIQGMGKLMAEMGAAGVLAGADGLRATAKGVRLRFRNGRRTAIRGPYKGGNELMGSFCQMETRTLDEAVEWSSRFGEIFGEAEIDIRPMTEPWDLGFGTKPEGLLTTRYMAVHKADKKSEAGIRLTAEQQAKIAAVLAQMKAAKVLIAAEWLQPSSSGTRLNFKAGKRLVTDGPFAESKELIGGYCMLQVKSKDEAIEWAARFAKVFGDVEIDLRLMDDALTGSLQ